CGEMDIMEHVGNDQDRIFSSLHYPGNSGGNAQTESVVVPGVSDDFHIYTMDWTPDEIRFSVDGNVYHTFPNSTGLPFDHPFFLIVNVAMGGNFGGTIDPNFVESTMEIDYIRVYE
ncbi:MAG: glycoside hydrolase family 16 protein, partial [Bacteroidia bacterium]|nr:glycoside hydrolase family 16 protein [Bacteroidia bacterium]